jgi:hypothetical protein
LGCPERYKNSSDVFARKKSGFNCRRSKEKRLELVLRDINRKPWQRFAKGATVVFAYTELCFSIACSLKCSGTTIRLPDLPKIECFASGTLVATATGKKAIQELAIGDRVLAYNLNRGQIVESCILRSHRSEVNEIFELHFDGDDVICATREHPFYVKDKGWTRVVDLVQGDACLGRGNQWVTLVRSACISSSVQVYNISTENEGNFFVGNHGVLVHHKPYLV